MYCHEDHFPVVSVDTVAYCLRTYELGGNGHSLCPLPETNNMAVQRLIARYSPGLWPFYSHPHFLTL